MMSSLQIFDAKSHQKILLEAKAQFSARGWSIKAPLERESDFSAYASGCGISIRMVESECLHYINPQRIFEFMQEKSNNSRIHGRPFLCIVSDDFGAFCLQQLVSRHVMICLLRDLPAVTDIATFRYEFPTNPSAIQVLIADRSLHICAWLRDAAVALKDYEGAIAWARKTISFRSVPINFHVRLIDLLDGSGDAQGAYEATCSALHVFPGAPALIGRKGSIGSKLGRTPSIRGSIAGPSKVRTDDTAYLLDPTKNAAARSSVSPAPARVRVGVLSKLKSLW